MSMRKKTPLSDMQRVSASAVDVASYLASTCLGQLPEANSPDGGWAMLRGLTIQLYFEAFAEAYRMRHPRILLAMPEVAEQLTIAGERIVDTLPLRELTPEHFGHVHETLVGYRLEGSEVVPSNGRRKYGAHFTPADLAHKVTLRTVEPLFACGVSPERTLELRIADPAVGAGAFLLANVRILGARVLEAGLAATLDEAKRLAAIHCCYGVDKDRYAVLAAKYALTLECRADRMPSTWLDDNIHHGDALVGLRNEQLSRFSWRLTDAKEPWLEELVQQGMDAAAAARRARIGELSTQARQAS